MSLRIHHAIPTDIHVWASEAHAMARSSVGGGRQNPGFNRLSDATEKRKAAGNIANSDIGCASLEHHAATDTH